jgi:GTP cyclohydrolase I
MVVRVVPFYSHCEHHLAAIIGHAVVAYIPNKKIVGLSKIDRVVDMFARRLQVQERLTNQIAEAIQENLEPKGVAVWINARHLCIESRGVRNQNSATDSLALRGVFKEDPRTRAEFLAVARSKVQ